MLLLPAESTPTRDARDWAALEAAADPSPCPCAHHLLARADFDRLVEEVEGFARDAYRQAYDAYSHAFYAWRKSKAKRKGPEPVKPSYVLTGEQAAAVATARQHERHTHVCARCGREHIITPQRYRPASLAPSALTRLRKHERAALAARPVTVRLAPDVPAADVAPRLAPYGLTPVSYQVHAVPRLREELAALEDEARATGWESAWRECRRLALREDLARCEAVAA